MAKDPAFLFYSQDFITGTMFMSNEQIGIYIRLLCAQHQHGGLIEKTAFNSIVGTHDIIRAKFIETEDGFYNERLMNEMVKRTKKSCNLSANALKRWEKGCKSDAIALQGDMPTEDENEDENENEDLNVFKNENEKKKIEETVPIVLHELQSKILSEYPHVSGMKLQLTFEQAEKLSSEFPPNVISEILDAMENKSDLRKKYTSVNLTIRNWIKIRSNTHGNINGPTLYQRPPAKGEHDPEKWRRLIAEAYS
ncbi:MAG: hypothetical protein Q8K40_03620 [Ignavibacteria bacterium]|nr:hypothetical protein [Ignavibacteria bacterium]